LRLAIVQAIGFMSETMQRDLFEKELPKIINIVLGMYQREKNHLPITQVSYCHPFENGSWKKVNRILLLLFSSWLNR